MSVLHGPKLKICPKNAVFQTATMGASSELIQIKAATVRHSLEILSPTDVIYINSKAVVRCHDIVND